MSVVDSVEILKGRPLTDDEYFKAAVLGWGVELVRPPLFLFFSPSPAVSCSPLPSTTHVVTGRSACDTLSHTPCPLPIGAREAVSDTSWHAVEKSG